MKSCLGGKIRTATYALAISCLAVAGAAQAHSDNAVSRNAVTLSNGSSFSWHAKKSTPAQAAAAQSTTSRPGAGPRFGRGSWVCSPAGFGRRSTCRGR